MRKVRGPGFSKQQIELEHCQICKGKAVVQGLFYELVCTDCNGSGWVVADSRSMLSLDELVTQLSFKLQQIQRENAALKFSANAARPEQHYERNNRLGAGGTNFTGD